MGLSSDLAERIEAEWGGSRTVLVAGPANATALAEIQDYASFELSRGYFDFVARYGGAIVGPYSVYGVGASEAMGADEASVITVTARFRADAWPGAQAGLVASMDHAGNPMILRPDGSVVLADHDAGWAEEVWPTFDAFLEWCIAR